ncbi:MAG: hypothetical protein PHG82_03760 [Candidatus Gracilibacteria bacterium]|nr:hypothetical protein [Candidatus Gracilibacteria bacterium]
MSEIANKYNGDINSYLKETFKSPKSETYKNYLIQKTRESTRSELSSLKDFLDMKKDIATNEDDKLQLMDLETSIDTNPTQNNQNNNLQDSNDNLNNSDIVFVGGTIEENVRVLFKGKEKMTSSLNGNISPLGNGLYELELNRIDNDGSDLGEIAKLRLRYNPYGNTVQIINEYNNRIIGEQAINFPRNGYMNYQNSRYPSTNFRINLDHGPAININLAFPNRK